MEWLLEKPFPFHCITSLLELKKNMHLDRTASETALDEDHHGNCNSFLNTVNTLQGDKGSNPSSVSDRFCFFDAR